MRASAAASMSGPSKVVLSRGSPIRSDEIACFKRAIKESRTELCTSRRRNVVQRCPEVPIAEKTIARTARSRSADGVTIMALLPPNSRMLRPNRAATIGPTIRPIRVEPVAETMAIPVERASASPCSAPPITSCTSPVGASAPKRSRARAKTPIVASAVSGVLSDGFQITGSPHTSASAAFQHQTATGKLNAEITAQGPIGCQVSIMR